MTTRRGGFGGALGRRALLRGALLGGAGLAAAALLGCGGEDDEEGEGGEGERFYPEAGPAGWGYHGVRGPEHWAELSTAYAACGGGLQSPIDIDGYAARSGGGPIAFSYAAPASGVHYDGKFVHVDYGPGNTIEVGGVTYSLAGAHAHAPSEHRVGGEQFAAEMHLVHSGGGGLAVVAQLFTLGAASPLLQPMIDEAPTHGETAAEGVAIDPAGYVPERGGYWRYDGSTTTPPCREGVAWFVLREPRTASQYQVDHLLALGGGPSNRPVQPLGGRAVTAGGEA